MDISLIQEAIAETQENRKDRAPRQRADRTVYYVVDADRTKLFYVGRDENAARQAKRDNPKATLASAGSQASLPPEILAIVFREHPTLADSFVAVGGQWGLSQKQTAEKKTAWAKTVLTGLIAYNRFAKKAGKPLVVLSGGELPDGEWYVAKTSGANRVDIQDDDLALLRGEANGEASE